MEVKEEFSHMSMSTDCGNLSKSKNPNNIMQIQMMGFVLLTYL